MNIKCLAPFIQVVLVAGCGGAMAASTAAPALPVLKAPAGLSGSRHAVTAGELTHDAPVAGLAASLRDWGFRGGTEAGYRGSGKVFSVVTSRTLQFETAAGARSFVAMVGAHAPAYEGGVSTAAPITSAGRRGFVLTAGACGCATEVPQLLAVVSSGPRVTWLEATGKGATRATLTALLARAP